MPTVADRRRPRASDRPDSPYLLDSFGRRAVDMRVSLIDKCNLRCQYCMPADGLAWLPKNELLSTSELNRLVRIAVQRLGVTTIRFTGGEPLLNPDAVAIVQAAATLPERPRVAMTTNGIGLVRQARALAAAGLSRVNVSLDSLDPATFHAITRRDRLADVLAGLAAAGEAGLSPIKVNAVLLRGVNAHEACGLLEYCLERGYELRFIEQMPLDPQHGWRREQMVTAEEILALLAGRFHLTPASQARGSAPAERWLVDGGPGSVGVIASVTQPFCAACDRTRLTADGQIRTCLFATGETDLRGPLRAGADDEELAEIWRSAMWQKAAGHGVNTPGFSQPARPMSAIGG
ncbi:MAG: GTP 3',8-cyclase MoaA [Thermocrispum sp.]